MKTERFSTIFFCPTKSSNRSGRSRWSNSRSSVEATGDVTSDFLTSSFIIQAVHHHSTRNVGSNGYRVVGKFHLLLSGFGELEQRRGIEAYAGAGIFSERSEEFLFRRGVFQPV